MSWNCGIFIFSLSLGLYYAGFLSALVMSLVGAEKAIMFYISKTFNKIFDIPHYNNNLKKYLEYGFSNNFDLGLIFLLII